MTREEAIKTWLPIISMGVDNMPELKEAFDMAVKALEQEPILDKIRAEIEQIIGEHNLDDYDFCSGLICARKIIDKYKVESENP